MRANLGGMEKGGDEGLVPAGGCSVCWVGLWVQILLIQACDVSCLALELSSVRWALRGVASLELIQKQGWSSSTKNTAPVKPCFLCPFL